jgi:hypothetical protein
MLAAAMAMLAGACASTSTPEQDLAYERWGACRVAGSDLEAIDPSGRIRFQYLSMNDRGRVLDCLASANRAGPTLPEPVAIGRPGGR